MSAASGVNIEARLNIPYPLERRGEKRQTASGLPTGIANRCTDKKRFRLEQPVCRQGLRQAANDE